MYVYTYIYLNIKFIGMVRMVAVVSLPIIGGCSVVYCSRSCSSEVVFVVSSN